MRAAPCLINIAFYVVDICLVLIIPLLAYFNFSITALETDFWTQRYLLLLVYIICEVFPFGAIDNFVLLMADGIILN